MNPAISNIFRRRTRGCVTHGVLLLLNTACLAPHIIPTRRMMNSPVLKSRHLERRFRGHGAGQNFILSVGLGLLAAGRCFLPGCPGGEHDECNHFDPGRGTGRSAADIFRLHVPVAPGIEHQPAQPRRVYRENLDLARFEGTSYRTDLEDWLRNKYHGHKMDAIVASGETSIDFVLKVRRKCGRRCR